LKTSFTAVAVMAMLAIAGCGSSDKKKSSSGSSGSNGALSYSDLDKQANTICKAATDKVAPLSSKFTGQAANDAPLYGQLLPVAKDRLAKLKALKPPAELKTTFDQYIALENGQITAAASVQSAAQSGDDAAYKQALLVLKKGGIKSDDVASKLGAVECTK
jgi:hypothetical protein